MSVSDINIARMARKFPKLSRAMRLKQIRKRKAMALAEREQRLEAFSRMTWERGKDIT